MKFSHFHRFGFIYILLLLFLCSWYGQYASMVAESGEFTWDAFWAATFENWQSEFLQLFVQTSGMYALARFIFHRADEDLKRIETKIDYLIGDYSDG